MLSRKNLFKKFFTKETLINAAGVVKPEHAPGKKPGSEMLHVPELSGEMIYMEAMRLGVDPSNFTADELKIRIITELSSGKR